MPHLDVTGASLYYETEGSDSAPALLLIHAGIASLRMWDPQVPALAQDHYVVRYDTRGFGNTSTEDIEFSDQADALAILDHLGVDRATVIGCSRGGRIAIDLAVEHPVRVRGLVTIGSGPSGFPDTELTPEEDAISDRMDAAFEAKDWEELGNLEVKLWAIGPARREEDLDADFVAKAYELNSLNLRHAEEAASHIPLEPPAFDRVVDIDVPALILVGDHDVSECLAQYEYLSTTLPKADSARFPRSAHLPNVEQPDEFERILRQWLAQHGL
ncbi:MAG: alpha/beta fold hydrolase [Homoserinimonas sp.]